MHGAGFTSFSHNLSCYATICRLLPVIGRVRGVYWWLTDCVAQSWESPIASVLYHEGWMVFTCYSQRIYGKVCPVWTCGATTPTTEGPSGMRGFEPLTKSSATPNPLYPSTWGVWTPDQGFYEQPSNQLYPMETWQLRYAERRRSCHLRAYQQICHTGLQMPCNAPDR